MISSQKIGCEEIGTGAGAKESKKLLEVLEQSSRQYREGEHSSTEELKERLKLKTE